jgi:membrane associated rhomboid family serine protease
MSAWKLFARSHERQGPLPTATVGLVGLQAAVYFIPGGYSLWDVGLNPRSLVGLGEKRRLVTAPLMHASLPHLTANLVALADVGSYLERKWGVLRFLGTTLLLGAISQGLLCE